MPASKQLATEVLIGLHEKLTGMTPRAPSRRDLITETAGAYGYIGKYFIPAAQAALQAKIAPEEGSRQAQVDKPE